MQDAQVQGEKAQVCDKTFEEGRESGGKSDHVWVEIEQGRLRGDGGILCHS